MVIHHAPDGVTLKPVKLLEIFLTFNIDGHLLGFVSKPLTALKMSDRVIEGKSERKKTASH